jgi:hypothetical protein
MKHAASALFLLSLAVPALAGCADLPAETESLGSARTDAPVVSLCYTGKTATREALRLQALALCPEGTGRVSVWDHDTFFNNCPLSRKNRVTYQCLAY